MLAQKLAECASVAAAQRATLEELLTYADVC
jgi:hypothetical protein